MINCFVQVMRTSAFAYDERVVNAFLNVPTVTIPEAPCSPPNTRISISGYVRLTNVHTEIFNGHTSVNTTVKSQLEVL